MRSKEILERYGSFVLGQALIDCCQKISTEDLKALPIGICENMLDWYKNMLFKIYGEMQEDNPSSDIEWIEKEFKRIGYKIKKEEKDFYIDIELVELKDEIP